MSPNITFVRHSEVIEVYQGKYNGHIDIPLSKKGEEDAKELAKKLKDVKFNAIYCSDLLRARQTLEAFGWRKNIIYSDKLREKSWGRHEGKSFDEIQKEGLKYENFEQWLSLLDGEDLESYRKKIKSYYFNTILKNRAKNILVVTHAGVIKTIISILQDISLEETFSIPLDYSDYISIENNIVVLK